MLLFWNGGPSPAQDVVEAWQLPGWRIALGVELVAHLEPVLSTERCQVGFCRESEELAQEFVRLIGIENLEARTAKAHPNASGQAAACDVLLPCRPDAPENEVDNAIVAATKASHAILCPVELRDRFKLTRRAS
jgi:hypothetical protein